MSINRWMDKEIVLHIHNGILLSHKKEHIWVSSNKVDEPRAYCTEWNKSEVQFSSVAVVSDSLRPHGLQHTRLPCPSPTPTVYSNSCPLSQCCHPTISSSVVPFSSTFNLPQHQGLFQWVSSLHQVVKLLGVSVSTSVLPMNTQDWSPLGWTGWISLQSKGLSRVFSNTTFQKHQFFGDQLSL